MKALIKVGYACNENCSFCHTLDVRHIDGDTSEIHAKIDRAAQLGHTMVVFSGGEATIRPELFDWAAHVVRLGMDTGLVTNGLMLAYPDFLERMLKLRLKYVYMSLHGGTARVHNLMVRADTFDAAAKALRNIAGRGLDVTINCVITAQNVTHLRGMVDLVLPYPDVTLKFSMTQPKGGGAKLFDFIMPKVSEVAAHVHDAMTYGLQKAGSKGPRFTHDGLPLCLLPGFEGLYDDLKTDRFWTMVDIGEPDFFPVDDKAKIQPEPCRDCALRGPCPGLYRGYHEEFGASELKPVRGRPRSNSYNYVFEKLCASDLPPLKSPDECPIHQDGITPWDRGRHLFIRNDGRLARFRADSRDFADVEIAQLKHDLGQVYLDVSRKTAPDDFQHDLVHLRRSAVCSGCEDRDDCTGMFEPVFEDVFGRDDSRVRALVQDLSGDVLDIGCGEGPYEALLAPLAGSKRIRYVGIDPDKTRITALRTRWPWAELHATTAEEFAASDARRFDHVLVLRSWNHLRDPSSVLRSLERLVRPGGSLLIVDNAAFGLARTRVQTQRAEAGPAVFEHYRNDVAEDAARLVSSRAFNLAERRDVSPATSNQWLLRYTRVADAA
jgi:MoaA/NifB/PqqE/SkfB family radical SAM enzyme/2-polyprenyl-3-methyl-5-hydroxy-6-metoxy-1,4-benzoquinol methylase